MLLESPRVTNCRSGKKNTLICCRGIAAGQAVVTDCSTGLVVCNAILIATLFTSSSCLPGEREKANCFEALLILREKGLKGCALLLPEALGAPPKSEATRHKQSEARGQLK